MFFLVKIEFLNVFLDVILNVLRMYFLMFNVLEQMFNSKVLFAGGGEIGELRLPDSQEF